MDRKVPGVFRDITDECGGNHSADIDRESKSGLGQKPREDRSETNCKDKLEDCGCVHIGMAFVLLLILDQKTVILGYGSWEKQSSQKLRLRYIWLWLRLR